ncbi:hypothetical protein BCD64_02605 [Nostoc sp. MBR 210]|nr:hypothetical protein BCD64_02605 [Nostoc sp. MBR 210]
MSDWLFDDPPNVAVITTLQVIEGKPILYVSHDEEDGVWQFHTNETFRDSDAKVVSLRRIVELDPSVTQLANLPLGWIAVRSGLGEIWQTFKRSK